MKRLLSIILSIVIIMTLVIASVGLTTIPVSSIKLNTSSIKLKAGNTYTLKVTIAPANATNKKLSFSTGNKKVATVDKNGKIKGIIAGKTVITVTSLSNKKAVAKCSVTVTRLPLYKIQVFNGTYTDGSIISSDETEVGKYIKEKFNIVFAFVNYVGDRLEKQNLMLASGDYPETINLQGEDVFQKYLKAGAVVQLDGYLKNMPNFRERYKVQIPYWRMSDTQGRLYKVERLAIQSYKSMYLSDAYVRYDVLEKQGFPKILSLSSLIGVLRQGLKDFPETNGKKTIGMSLCFAEDYGIAGIGQVMFEKGGTYVNVNNAVLFNTKTNKYVSRQEVQETKDSYHFFNKLYREGLLDPESFTAKSSDLQEKFGNAQPIASWYASWDFDLANQKYSASNMTDQMYHYQAVPVQTDAQVANGEVRLLNYSSTRPYESLVITKAVKQPERLMELWEWVASDEGMRICLSGLEGKQWVKKNGTYELTEEFIKNRLDADYIKKIGSQSGNGVPEVFPISRVDDANGIPLVITSIPDERIPYDKSERRLYQSWGNYLNFRDYVIKNGKPYDTGLITNVNIGKNYPELPKLLAQLVDYIKKNAAATIVNPKNDTEFEAAWSKYIEGYKKLQPEKLVDECNNQYGSLAKILDEMKKK